MKQILIDARALLVKGWTQRAASRDKDGLPPSAGKPAVCWCTYGALMTANWKESDTIYNWLEHKFDMKGGLIAWNDTPGRTQAEVLALFDKAIEACS